MKQTLLSMLLLAGISASAQSVIFEDSFDTYADFEYENIGNWTLIDVDARGTYGFSGVTFSGSQLAKSFQVFNSTTTNPALTPSATSNWTGRTGDKAAVCFAAVPGEGITANNDWLISPQIQLAASGNVLSFWAKSCDTQYGAEKFRVGVSTTNTQTTSFTIISPGAFVTNPATALWVEYTYNLDNYQGQNVYIAINCVSDDQFGFAIDDFKVSGTLSADDFFTQNLSLYPNPTSDVVNLSSSSASINTVKITDLNGRVVRNFGFSAVSSAQVNVSDLMSGMYLISVETNEGTGTSKFMKK